MALSEQDEDFIVSGLEALYKAIFVSSGLNQVREYIDVHEFGLALDLLAHIQLKSDVPPSLELRRLFEAPALKMSMTDGDRWRGVAKVRSGQTGR